VGVLFTDVAGFTAWCEQRRDQPEEVVATLQDLIARFETAAVRHGVQKIKTVGDAFMAAAGLTDADPNPALSLVKCGLDLIAAAAEHPAGWAVRVGVHVGPVVTGVLGQTQFSFDVWGHTVNAAARMESNGVPGRVTLSDEAWRDVAAVAAAVPRTVGAKGLGELTVWDVTGFK
jgi:class 3 adenylate cyclase